MNNYKMLQQCSSSWPGTEGRSYGAHIGINKMLESTEVKGMWWNYRDLTLEIWVAINQKDARSSHFAGNGESSTFFYKGVRSSVRTGVQEEKPGQMNLQINEIYWSDGGLNQYRHSRTIRKGQRGETEWQKRGIWILQKMNQE